ncbi:MAG: hypothetical protein ACYCOU_07405 [Sulfobacillus sp.]
MKLLFSNDWLKRKTAADPDVDIEAGRSLEGMRMSWSIMVTAATKESAKAAIAVDPQVREYGYVPTGVVEVINNAIDALPNHPELDVVVKTHGHCDESAWSFNIDVGQVPRS